MAISDFPAALPALATKQFVLRSVLLLFLLQAVRFFYRGFRIRRHFRQLHRQGIVSSFRSAHDITSRMLTRSRPFQRITRSSWDTCRS